MQLRWTRQTDSTGPQIDGQLAIDCCSLTIKINTTTADALSVSMVDVLVMVQQMLEAQKKSKNIDRMELTMYSGDTKVFEARYVDSHDSQVNT